MKKDIIGKTHTKEEINENKKINKLQLQNEILRDRLK